MLLIDLHSSCSSVRRLSCFVVVLVELLTRGILIDVVSSVVVVNVVLRRRVGLVVSLLQLLVEVVVLLERLEWMLLLLGVVSEGRVVVSGGRRDGR